ncbi:MAG: Gfo/Idh/MocA family protein [Armatimonadota bacterium]
MTQTRFAVIGGGGRTHQFLRVARQLPDLFTVSSVLVRNSEKREKLAQEWDVPTSSTLDELISSKPKFVVVCVSWESSPMLIKELFDRNVPVLSETPPAPNLEGLIQLYQQTDKGRMVQVSEQYHLRSMHHARILVAQSGLLGNITGAQVSAGHGYHGMSIMRKLLGVNFEPVEITAKVFTSPVVTSDASGEKRTEEYQTLGWLDYGNKLGVFDFTFSQYSTKIRASRILVRGDRGEIDNTTVRYLGQDAMPISTELIRHETFINSETDDCRENFVASEIHRSAHDTRYLKGITLGDDWIYYNPFFPAHLSEDQIAVATFLHRMSIYVDGGPSFYSLAEAAQDHYLGMMIEKAVETGMPMIAEPQVWSY